MVGSPASMSGYITDHICGEQERGKEGGGEKLKEIKKKKEGRNGEGEEKKERGKEEGRKEEGRKEL